MLILIVITIAALIVSIVGFAIKPHNEALKYLFDTISTITLAAILFLWLIVVIEQII